MTANIEYVIITPVRDEEQHIEHTIKSVIAQTITPAEWIIVNDGSTDSTGRIINEYAKKYSWIHTIHRGDRGFRKAGGGVIDAFYDGYNAKKTEKLDYIVKLDGDLSFDTDYFERCFEHFQNMTEIGIGGGAIFNIVSGVLKSEKHPIFHVRGATKIYKKECWDAIGGLLQVSGWDTIDEVKANMLGWKTRTFPDLKIVHYRETGAADGQWKSGVKYGRANYISGYHPLFMFLKCIKRIVQRPYVIGSVALAYGFASGYLKRVPRVDDKKMIEYLRKEQMKKLTLRDSIWK